MAGVVDTSVLLDIRLRDPAFGEASSARLASHLADGLTLCPVSYIELAPAFRGNHRFQQEFLERLEVNWRAQWRWWHPEIASENWAASIL